MDETLIENWNLKVDKEDFVIFLGDFCFRLDPKIYLDRLNGRIVFIRGNHDNSNSLDTKIFSLVFETESKEYFCVHRPEDYNQSYAINLVAHVHEKWKFQKVYSTTLVNVGVDVWNYSPVDINEILKEVKKWTKQQKV